MLSWDEFDKEEEGEVAAKGANAGHATEANMDRLDGAGAAAAVEARAVTANDSAAIVRAKFLTTIEHWNHLIPSRTQQ